MNKLSILAIALILALCAPLALADSAPVEAADIAAEATAAPSEAAGEGAAEAPEATAAPALTLQTVLATVNGADVTYADVKKYHDSIVSQYGSMYDVSDPSIASALKELAINYAVTEQVVKQKAQEMGLDVFTDEELAEIQVKADEAYQNAYDQVSAMFVAQGLAEDQVESTAAAYLESYGYTPETLLAQLRDSELYTRAFAAVAGDPDMDEEALKALFDERVAAAKDAYAANLAQYDTDVRNGGTIYYVPEGIRSVKHILVKMDGAEAAELKSTIAALETLPGDDAGRAELEKKIEDLKLPVQAKLDEIQSKIDAGEDFNALIDEYGEDPGMQEGSPYRDAGYTLSEATTMYDPPFQAAAMALEKPGDVSAPTLGAYGYHFIRYDHDIESREADYEAIKDSMKQAELTEREATLQNEAIEAWTEASTIETFMDRFTA